MNAFEKVERDSYTIPEVCRLAGISKGVYYKMKAEGRGPREVRMVGAVVRVTRAAYSDWIAQLESDPNLEQKEKLRAHSLAAVAGRGGA